jgi:N-acyl-phosphatidylethanolamine-hydrolysing phospholipase D
MSALLKGQGQPNKTIDMIQLTKIARLFRMKSRLVTLALLIPFLLTLSGCGSYVQRMVMRSLGSIGEPIKAPPRMITTPILPNAKLAVSWVGHATVLIQIEDKIIITDPLFTNTIGLLVKRYVKPGLNPALLTRVDFTLVSHIHFDHFSYGSLDMLPKNGTLVIPLGAVRYTPDFGFKDVEALKAWQSIDEDGVKITAVPAQHFSGRYGFDRRWLGGLDYTGYVIEYRGYTVFFAGDTGYNSELFKEIGRRFKIDLAILPITPGSLTNPGSGVHVGPVGALMIFKDVGAKYMMPMHYGTFFYGSETNPNAAIDRLREVAKEEGVLDRIVELQMGGQRIIF